jgi:hypothetical protein
MALVEDSLSTTTLADWQAGYRQGNSAITRLCQQSNWALSAAGGWQWQHGARIVNTGTIATGSQFWPVVCSPFGGVSLRVSVYGSCSSGGSDQIGVYLSDTWPFGAGVQVATLTIPGTAAIATATIDTQAYFGPILIYLKAESDIDDLVLQGWRGRLIGAEPDTDKLEHTKFTVARYVQEKEFVDTSPITSDMMQMCYRVGFHTKTLRGRGLLCLALEGGSVRNKEKLDQAAEGGVQVLLAGVRCRMGPVVRVYVRSYQQASDGDDSLIVRLNGVPQVHLLGTSGVQTQPVYEGWEYMDLDAITLDGTSIIDVIYEADPDAGQGHVLQDVSIITGYLA